MRRIYTDRRIAFLRARYPRMTIPDLTAAFNARFGLTQTEIAIRSLLNSQKIKCGRRRGFPAGTLLAYTQEQLQFIADNYTWLTIPQLTVEFNARFSTNKKSSHLRAFTRNHRIKSGRTGCFENGSRPWNAGTKGLVKPNSGNFKKGNKPLNWKPPGHERPHSKDGHILIKTSQQNPYTGFAGYYRSKHVVIWEEANGPVPSGMAVAFKDGNNGNCTIENLMLISRAELLALNQHGYKETPAELKPSVLAIAKLEVKVKKRTFA